MTSQGGVQGSPQRPRVGASGGFSDDLMNVAFDDEIRLADDIQDVHNRLADITQTLAIETAEFTINHALDRALAAGKTTSRPAWTRA